MKKILLILVMLSVSIFSQDEEEYDEDTKPEDRRPPKEGLPFKISEKKRLRVKDVKEKKEGWFPTGLPFIYFDANTGLGYGGRLFLFNNKTKDDPFFEYTPYRHRIFFHYANTTKNAQWHSIDYDAPYIFDTQFRLRTSVVYDANPNNLFFGIGEKSLKGLTYYERNDPRSRRVTNGRLDRTEEALAYRRPSRGHEIMYSPNAQINSLIHNQTQMLETPYATDRMYYRYDMENPQFNLSLERSFLNGVVRAVGGTRLSKAIVKPFDGKIYNAKDPVFGETDFPFMNVDVPTVHGKTKLTEEAENGGLIGYNGGVVNLLRVGLVYDTRDFEPDPNKGIFAEVTHEHSDRGIGSNFQYNKTFYSVRVFYSPFSKYVDKLVFAGRAAFVNTRGDAPFWEYRSMWSTEGNISGLGGRTTLRGFLQDRFVGPAMGYGNLEVRWKFYEVPGFAFNLVPFFDFGRVWDRAALANLKDYKYSYGLGFRMAWNQSTIIYIDVGSSRENTAQAYMNFNHIF